MGDARRNVQSSSAFAHWLNVPAELLFHSTGRAENSSLPKYALIGSDGGGRSVDALAQDSLTCKNAPVPVLYTHDARPSSKRVLDFDGVIADRALHLRAIRRFEATVIDLNKSEYYARYLGYDDIGLFEALAKDRRISLSDEKIEEWVAAKSCIVEEMLSSDAILFPGAAACVKMFAARVPLAVASGALEPEIEIVLEHAGLRSSFGAILRHRTGCAVNRPPTYICWRWRS